MYFGIVCNSTWQWKEVGSNTFALILRSLDRNPISFNVLSLTALDSVDQHLFNDQSEKFVSNCVKTLLGIGNNLALVLEECGNNVGVTKELQCNYMSCNYILPQFNTKHSYFFFFTTNPRSKQKGTLNLNISRVQTRNLN